MSDQDADDAYDTIVEHPGERGESGIRGDGLLLRNGQEIRARHHPWALAGIWAWQSALALAASWPTASLVRASFAGDSRAGEPIWTAGGHALLDWLWHEAHGVAALARGAVLALVIGAFAGLVPLAGLMFAMAYETEDGRRIGASRSLAAALAVLRPFAVLFAVLGLAQGSVLGIGFAAASLFESWYHVPMGEAHAQQLEGVVVLPFLFTASVLGVVHDLARSAVVRSGGTGWRGLVLGARSFRVAPLRLWCSWVWRAIAALALVFVAGVGVARVGGHGGFALMGVALLHQGVVLSRAVLRASWLARALRASSQEGAI